MTGREDKERLDQNKAQVFTSDLSVSEFLLLEELGYTPLGLVMGSCVYQVGFQAAPWKDSLELTNVTQAMYTARHLAMSRLLEEVKYLGADGVVGMRLDIGGKHLGLDNSMLEFIAIGTAVRLPAGETHPSPEPFTSSLSVQDLYRLQVAGYRPVGLVIGNCVYHVAYQPRNYPTIQAMPNVEMTNYSAAIYHARELAMDRMQAEAIAGGASGIVGVMVSEHARNWDRNVLEFMAVGTSVRRVGGRGDTASLPAPRLTLSLDERG